MSDHDTPDGRGLQPPSYPNTFYSSGSSTGSDPTEDTPPSPVAISFEEDLYNQPGVLAPQIPASVGNTNGVKDVKRPQPKQTATPRTGVTPPRSRLGAIDEDSDNVYPDIPGAPPRNPRRVLGMPMPRPFSFGFARPPQLKSQQQGPPAVKNIYDDIQGPNGEKFSDMRNNGGFGLSPSKGRWRAWWPALIVLAITIIVLVVVLPVELTKRKNRSSSTTASSGSSSSTTTGFPAGNFSITSALTNVVTSCTTISAAWSCYPNVVYSTSATASVTTLEWIITSSPGNDNGNGYDYAISSANQLFSYTFNDSSLTLTNNGSADAAWTFTWPFTKVVVPAANITASNTQARCYFNNSMLTGRLYTNKMATLPSSNSTDGSGSVDNGGIYQPWPYALDFTETATSQQGEPSCFEFVNGADGAPIDIPIPPVGSSCACRYANWNLD